MDGFKRMVQLDSLQELELSCYEEVSQIPENEGDLETTVSYVRDKRDGKLYIKKELKNTDKDVYQALMNYPVDNEKKLAGVPEIKSITDDRSTTYIIEEFVNLPTLNKLMESGAVGVEELISIFREVSIVLENLHGGKKPITHGDITARNILVDMDAVRGKTKNQKVYLVDFNRGDKHLLKADISQDMKKTCAVLRDCMDILMLKSITELDGDMWNNLKDIAETGPGRFTTDRQLTQALGRLIGKRAPREVKPKKKSYLLPGFRTKKVWKAVLALLGYAAMLWLAFAIEVDAEGIMGLYTRVCTFMLMFSYPMWFANYMGVRDKYSWMTGKNVIKKIIGHVVAMIAIFGFWMMMIILPDLLHII